DGDAEISDEAVDPVHRQEQRLGDEIEPAPVDQPIELVEVEPVVVTGDDRYLFGAGEEPPVEGPGPTRPDRLRRTVRIALKVADVVGDRAGREFRVDLGGGIGEERCGPILVGDAEPYIRRSE